MSTRYLKKIYGNDAALEESNHESESELNDIHVGGSKKKQFNVFDLLNESSDNETENIKENETDEEEVEIDDNKTKSKKKRKKHRKAYKQKEAQEENSDHQSSKDQDSLDEIDRTVRQINKLLGEPTPSTSLGSSDDPQLSLITKSKEQTLTVQHKHLNAYNELKRIFGSKTVQAEQTTRGRTGHLKKTWLVSVRDNMLPTSKSGISMTIDRSMTGTNEKGVQYFVYEHCSSYRQVQKKFINAVESLNPENIISIVNEYPYNVDALLQSAELCKLNEDLAMAAKLIERAIFYLEYAFHPRFNMTTANCRMDYKKQQNRALFIALFKHLVLVGGKACYRTSLELCKLLLSLDPEEDPLAVVLMIDFYAIRSKEYEWFCEFCNLWENSRNLQQLPNIAYSLALAHFHLGNLERADEALQNALIMFPSLLNQLIDKCGINADVTVRVHDFFSIRADKSTPEALNKLQALYLARSFHLWKEAEILPWLEKNVHIVLQQVESNDSYVKFCEVKRSKRYKGKLPRNILRHLILSDLKHATVDAQDVQNDGPILSHDPLPPENSIDIYTNPRTARRSNQTNSNILSLFFSSFFIDLENRIIGGDNPDDQGYQNEYD